MLVLREQWHYWDGGRFRYLLRASNVGLRRST